MPRLKTFQAKDIPLRAVLNGAAMTATMRGGNLVEYLQRLYPAAHENVVYAKLRKAEDAGLVEYGTSIRGAWLTPAGRARLEELVTR